MASFNMTAVARCVASGTLGPAGASNEIWATGFWVTVPEDPDMTAFDPENYLTTAAQPFFTTMMSICAPFVRLTEIKCNVFEMTTVSGRYGIHQRTDPTVLVEGLNVAGSARDGATYITALGWALSTQHASRGKAVKGRMFIPSPGGNVSEAGSPFDDAGHWAAAEVESWSEVLSPAWDALNVHQDGSPSSWYAFPTLVSVPSSGTAFLCNPADATTVENNVWAMRSRKNALPAGGTRTTHDFYDPTP